MYKEPVFFQPGRHGCIDFCYDRDGVLVGHYSGETLEQVRLRYPGAQVGELEEVHAASEAMFRSPPTEITESRFDELLEVLPPMRWRGKDDTESFMLSERIYGDITTICARIGNRYFTLSDSVSLTHEEIIAACEKA